MKKTFLVAVALASLIGTSFAADPCKEKTAEAKKLFAKCKAMRRDRLIIKVALVHIRF